MSSYNKYYQKENYFGEPYKELIKYFSSLNPKSLVLDLGCGQGRDSIALGRMGFNVVAVDTSSVGINQIKSVVLKENLKVKAVVGDLRNVTNIPVYDVILMNSMFHFYKNDIEQESKTLSNILTSMKTTSRLILTVQDSEFRRKHIREIVDTNKQDFSIEHTEKFLYKEFKSIYYMIVIRKN